MTAKPQASFLWLRELFCGGILGAAAILPGVSGGVLALSLGLYEPFMDLLTQPRQVLKRDGRRFLILFLGWICGMLTVSRGLAAALGHANTLTIWLFIGLIAGTVPGLWRQAVEKGSGTVEGITFLFCAFLGGVLLPMAGQAVPLLRDPPTLWHYGFCGALWGLGVILPGLSTASLLIALGLYQPLLEGLAELDPQVLLGCALGLCLTLLLLAKLMCWLFRRYPAITFHGILGWMTASTLALVPVQYTGPGELALSLVWGGAGFFGSVLLNRMGEST